jgi:hypothetical protein
VIATPPARRAITASLGIFLDPSFPAFPGRHHLKHRRDKEALFDSFEKTICSDHVVQA